MNTIKTLETLENEIIGSMQSEIRWNKETDIAQLKHIMDIKLIELNIVREAISRLRYWSE